MKIALCFMISGDQILVKENIWKEWIDVNSDIINIYFHYKDINTIKSNWIKKYAIPKANVVETSYFHMVPAYLSILSYAAQHDLDNQWFSLLTDTCVPIISPLKFREMFFKYAAFSIIDVRPAWWNVNFHKRANMSRLKKEFHLGNNPWFILKREDVARCFMYATANKPLYNLICEGGVANESIFSIILHTFNQLDKIKKADTHVTDWARMTTATSPHVFTKGDKADIDFIEKTMHENKYIMFLRKIHKDFPEEILNDFIWKEDHDDNIREKRVARILRLEHKMFWEKWTASCSPVLFIPVAITMIASVIWYVFG